VDSRLKIESTDLKPILCVLQVETLSRGSSKINMPRMRKKQLKLVETWVTTQCLCMFAVTMCLKMKSCFIGLLTTTDSVAMSRQMTPGLIYLKNMMAKY